MFGLLRFKTRFLGLVFLGLALCFSDLGVSTAWAKRNNAELGDVGTYQTIALADLPKQGRDVYGLILQGGPFQFEKDGVVFGNRERLLPSYRRGYYREYTVPTPGSRDRGARRIVCGGERKEPVVCFYTDDHYNSFRKIVP